MKKDKGYLLVNVIGLSVAVACCLLLVFWIKFELSYERCYLDYERIHRVVKLEKRPDGVAKDTYIRPSFEDQLKESFPQIESAGLLSIEKLPFIEVDSDKEGVSLEYGTCNEDFLRIFSYEYLAGNPMSIMTNKQIIITEEAAKKMFGSESPIGKKISFGGNFLVLEIGAVIKMPLNTQIRFDLLNPSRSKGRGGVMFLMFREDVKITPELQEQLSTFPHTLGYDKYTIEIQPIKEAYLHSDWDTNSGSMTEIYLFSFVAFLILLIAIINYINTSIARSINRIKEVGVRKVTGSSRNKLIVRFLSDSFLLSFFAVLLAFIPTVVLFPAFSEIMGLKISLHFDWAILFIALLFCLLITFFSGGYSAFYLSSFNPILIFRGGSKTGSKEKFRKILIGLQLFLSIAILICTLLVHKQINGIYTADTGVDRENIYVFESGLWYSSEDFIQEIKKNPNVIDASIAMTAPYNASYGYSGISWEGSSDDVKEVEFVEICCDYHYANTFGLDLLSGQFIQPGLTWFYDQTEDTYAIVINESFQKLMGEENPIGITVTYGWGRKGKIIGVLKDFNFKPLKENITPLIMSFNPEACSKVYVKTNGQNSKETFSFVLEKYNEMKPNKETPANYYTVKEEYDRMYAKELRMGKLFVVFSIISFILSLMGVISMISFMAEKRTKEIAIRKINGASIAGIIRLFVVEILKIGIIATVFALPIAYFVMNSWLQSYVYQTNLSWWVFICVPLVIFLLVAITIGIQIFFVARKNPVESLRSE
ncbi:FtsX-like permease family protein [Bacteroidales bacterium OttesenSCG-928-M11]|nr:FtsX-like permease family protein [Bacteroidales bacterium OttesenSCG-928-M11]